MPEINVKHRFENLPVNVPETATIADVKNEIFRLYQIPVSQQRLILAGRVLENHETIARVKVVANTGLHLSLESPRAAATPSSTSSSATAASGTIPLVEFQVDPNCATTLNNKRLFWIVHHVPQKEDFSNLQFESNFFQIDGLKYEPNNLNSVLQAFKARYRKNKENFERTQKLEKTCLALIAVPNLNYVESSASDLYQGNVKTFSHPRLDPHGDMISVTPIFAFDSSTYTIAVNPSFRNAVKEGGTLETHYKLLNSTIEQNRESFLPQNEEKKYEYIYAQKKDGGFTPEIVREIKDNCGSTLTDLQISEIMQTVKFVFGELIKSLTTQEKRKITETALWKTICNDTLSAEEADAISEVTITAANSNEEATKYARLLRGYESGNLQFAAEVKKFYLACMEHFANYLTSQNTATLPVAPKPSTGTTTTTTTTSGTTTTNGTTTTTTTPISNAGNSSNNNSSYNNSSYNNSSNNNSSNNNSSNSTGTLTQAQAQAQAQIQAQAHQAQIQAQAHQAQAQAYMQALQQQLSYYSTLSYYHLMSMMAGYQQTATSNAAANPNTANTLLTNNRTTNVSPTVSSSTANAAPTVNSSTANAAPTVSSSTANAAPTVNSSTANTVSNAPPAGSKRPRENDQGDTQRPFAVVQPSLFVNYVQNASNSSANNSSAPTNSLANIAANTTVNDEPETKFLFIDHGGVLDGSYVPRTETISPADLIIDNNNDPEYINVLKNGVAIINNLNSLVNDYDYQIAFHSKNQEANQDAILMKLQTACTNKGFQFPPIHSMAVYDPSKYRNVSSNNPTIEERNGIKRVCWGTKSIVNQRMVEDGKDKVRRALEKALNIPSTQRKFHAVFDDGPSILEVAKEEGYQTFVINETQPLDQALKKVIDAERAARQRKRARIATQ
ncbi:MAG: hypothetical protein JSS07_10055 [Proteobacteria bacterium]|nr:hypothetical protein [Pseudomonadota bacterium]